MIQNLGLGIFEELRFIIELSLGLYPVFFIYFQKKKNFWFKFIIPYIGILGTSISYCFFFQYIINVSNWGFTVFFSSTWYLFLTFLIFIHSIYCFEMKINDGILFIIGGYAIQHLDMILANEIVRFILYPDVVNHLFIYFLICVGFTVLFYTPYYLTIFFFNKSRASILDDNISTRILLLVLIVMLYVSTYCFQNFFRSYGSYDIQVISAIGDCFTSTMLIVAMFMIEKASIDKREKEFMKLMYQKEKERYDSFKGNIDYMNVMLHDLKYEIKKLADDGAISVSSYDEIKKNISAYGANIDTGNEVMNLIMSDITYRCQSNNIAFSPLVDGKALNLIDKNDLYIGMSNLFDNAISYVKELPKDKRYINFIVKKVNNFIIIKETNYLMNPNLIEFNKDGSIKSTKKSDKQHGYGTKSIVLFAKKYKGDAYFKVENNEFITTITIPN